MDMQKINSTGRFDNFMNLQSFHWRRLALALAVVSGFFAVGLSRVDIETDIVGFLPKGDPVISDALYIFKNHPIQDQLVIDISLQKENLELLVDCAKRVENNLRQSNLFEKVGLQDFQSLLPDLAFHILHHLPMLFSTEGIWHVKEWLVKPGILLRRHEDKFLLDRTLQRARLRMDKWLVGQGSLMLILGASSTVVFLIFHVRYAYALGVVMGVLNIIPVLGGAIGIALALLSAGIDSWASVIAVAVFYTVYVWIENSYLIPRIMQNRLNIPGLAVLVSLLIGSALAGVLGAMVSVPTAVLVAELLDEYVVHKETA